MTPTEIERTYFLRTSTGRDPRAVLENRSGRQGSGVFDSGREAESRCVPPKFESWNCTPGNETIRACRVAIESGSPGKSSSSAAHMYLGIALIGEKKSAEARPEFEAAAKSNAPEVAKAHYYLGGIYWGNREYSLAADELETYLKLVPKAPEAEKVRQTIKELRSRH